MYSYTEIEKHFGISHSHLKNICNKHNIQDESTNGSFF